MDATTRQFLTRLHDQKNGVGVRRVRRRRWLLWAAGLALAVVALVGGEYGLPSILVAASALACGWSIAETNALWWRMRLWPMFQQYIDWQKVHRDLQAADEDS